MEFIDFVTSGQKAMKRRRSLEILPFAVILVLGFLVRLHHLDTTGIWGDQAFTLNTAMRWVNGGRVPLAANKSSIGVMNPPMIEYLYALALRCRPDILSVAVLTLVSGMIGIVAAGWATYRAIGRRAAFWTMLIFAVNPWAVYYSQLIWNQTMVPVFSSLTLACLLVYFAVEQQPLALVLSFVWAACMTQVHPGTSVQLVTMALVCLLFWRKLKRRSVIVGAILFVLLYVPFLVYESAVGWSDVRTAVDLVGQSGAFSLAPVLITLDLLQAQGLLASVRWVPTFDKVSTFLFVLALAYVVFTGLRDWLGRHRNREAGRTFATSCILLLWLTMPVLLYLRSSHYLQTYYLLGQLPAHFIVLGMGFDGLHGKLEQMVSRICRRRLRRGVRLAVGSLLWVPLLTLLGWQLIFNLQFQQHRYDAAQGAAQVRHLRTAIQRSSRLLDEYPSSVLVALSAGHSVETSDLALLREFVSRERVLLADGRLALPIPSTRAIYLDAQGGTRASTWLSRTAEPIRDEAFQVLDERWRFYMLSSGAGMKGSGGRVPASFDAEWTNGLTITGYERGALRGGSTLPLTLTWRIENPVPDVLYHFGTYLLTADSQLVAQSDGPGFDSVQWRAGDSFITWFDITAPRALAPSRYRVGVALYRWPDVERVRLKSGADMALLDEIEILEPY